MVDREHEKLKWNTFLNISGLQRRKNNSTMKQLVCQPLSPMFNLHTPMADQPEHKCSDVIQCSIQHYLLCILNPKEVLISDL